ncbi:MAG: hypothetical protein JW954_00210 [Dehalococcoidaceae bacterium]|nr:hypothetical protein [Dehalococcoidaceae bacterium]
MADNKEKITVEGYEISLDKNGLNSEEVALILSTLTRQCQELTGEIDVLKRKEGHLASLTRLAEKTVVDADTIARDIKADAEMAARETLDKARCEADAAYKQAVTQLKEMARQISRVAEALDNPSEKCNSSGNKDTDQAEALLANFFSGEVNEDMHKLPLYKGPEKCRGEVGIEIIPPLDINIVMQLIQHLEQLPQVDKVELLSRVDKPLIIICLKQNLDVHAILQDMAYIEKVTPSEEPEQTRPTFSVILKSANRAGAHNK